MQDLFEDYGKYLFSTIVAVLLWELVRYNVAFAVMILAPVGIASIITVAINVIVRWWFGRDWSW